MDDVGLELLKPLQHFVGMLCPWDYAADKPGIWLVYRDCLFCPLGLADHQGLLVDLLKISIYVQRVGGNAPYTAVNMCNFHVVIRIPIKMAVVNFEAVL